METKQNLESKGDIEKASESVYDIVREWYQHILSHRRPRNALSMTKSPNTNGSALMTSL